MASVGNFPEFILIGNPTCRRVACWRDALARRGWPDARLVSYADLLTGKTRLLDHLTPNGWLRFESASENWDTVKLLLKHGIAPAEQEGYPVLSPREIDPIVYQRGLLVHPRQLYLGFVRLLDELQPDLTGADVRSLNTPDEIAVLFDKPRCQHRLQQAGLPVPEFIEPVRSYSELRTRYGPSARVMVKFAHGSGAAGCAAVEWVNGRTRAITTLETAHAQGRTWMFCSKRVRSYTDERAVSEIVDRLCVERVQVEQWLPKAQWNGRECDLRIVTIGGVPRHSVVRIGSSPFTNLNLGNRRGDIAEVVEQMGEAWESVRASCRGAARVFAGCHNLGIDVLIRPDFRRHHILEINAFGDLLPNLLDAGMDTYTATLAALEETWRTTPFARRPLARRASEG